MLLIPENDEFQGCISNSTDYFTVTAPHTLCLYVISAWARWHSVLRSEYLLFRNDDQLGFNVLNVRTFLWNTHTHIHTKVSSKILKYMNHKTQFFCLRPWEPRQINYTLLYYLTVKWKTHASFWILWCFLWLVRKWAGQYWKQVLLVNPVCHQKKGGFVHTLYASFISVK